MKPLDSPDSYSSRIRRSTLNLFRWTAIWGLSFAFFAFGPKFIWHNAAPITWIACGVSVLLGIGGIIAHRNQIRDQDEMQQRVSLEGYAVTLGAVIIVGCPYSILQGYKLVPAEGAIPVLMIVIAVTLFTSMLVGTRRYR
jgi:hypothetical protein